MLLELDIAKDKHFPSGQQQATKQRTKAPDTDEPTVATPPENTVGLIAPDAPETAPVSQAKDSAGQIGELRDQLAELAQNLEEVVADNASMSKVFDADDKLMAALAENKRLRAEVSSLRERVNGLLGEKNEAVRLMKSWRSKFEKLEKAGASA